MIKRNELRKVDHRIQEYMKHPAVLMVKYPGESVYTSHGELLIWTICSSKCSLYYIYFLGMDIACVRDH